MDKKTINKLKVKFAGDNDWKQLRGLLIAKLIECESEEDMTNLIRGLLGSMFKNTKEIDEARKKANLEVLTEIEKRNLEKKD